MEAENARGSDLDRSPMTEDQARQIYQDLWTHFPDIRMWFNNACKTKQQRQETTNAMLNRIMPLPHAVVDKVVSDMINGKIAVIPEFKSRSYLSYHIADCARRIMEEQDANEERERDRAEMRRVREERKSEERPTVSGRELLLAREEIASRAPGGVEGEEKEKWVQKEWKQLLDQSYD